MLTIVQEYIPQISVIIADSKIAAVVCVYSIAPGTRSPGHNTENDFSLYFHSYPRFKVWYYHKMLSLFYLMIVIFIT